ncbi:MAG: tetratricopeptide repeat protein [Acidimicrobiia bacterium]
MPDLLETGREAVRKNHWNEAVTALEEANLDGQLSADDLSMLAEALWWSGEPDEAVEAFERAFSAYEREQRLVEAASIGARLAYFAMRRLSMSIAGGWIARVERLLEGQAESVGHGWLKILSVAKALMFDNDMGGAIALADEAIDLGRRFGNAGIQAMGMSFKGVAMVHSGEWRQGISLMDEATVVATSETGDLRAASDVYCNTIAVCRNLGDYRRAGEWTDKADRWMHAHSVGGYSGICQVHRAELKRLRGSWSEAEQDARRACIELERFHIMDGIGFAQYEIGEVRRRMGDFPSAEKAFQRAYEYGHDAQPGMSLLLLNQGEVAEAAKSISAAMGRPDSAVPAPATADTLSRAHLLPAQVEIALAAGDTDTARRAVLELDQIATHYEGPTWIATALTSRGALDLHEGHSDQAVEVLSRAWRLWQEIGLPYESAQARSLLGQARLAQGDEAAARKELRAAASTFSQLGAAFDLRRLQETTGDETAGRRERVTRAFMFTDIVTSTDLIGLIGDAAWENLLRWHDRALREALSKSGGDEVRHTGDGFFAAFDDPRASIDCAVRIQRMLEQHRREHGFAPWVRIGMHVAEATRESGDYSGHGVHAAARVGALANREEIVVSAELLEAAGTIPYPVSETRSVTLKGITQPLLVQTIDWH